MKLNISFSKALYFISLRIEKTQFRNQTVFIQSEIGPAEFFGSTLRNIMYFEGTITGKYKSQFEKKNQSRLFLGHSNIQILKDKKIGESELPYSVIRTNSQI